jgi:hypothetical protein
MDTDIRKAVATILAVVLVVVMWYGSYLPMQKSYAYIDMLQRLGTVQSWDQFVGLVTVPLDMMSPIGQEELVRNFGGTIAMRIVQTNGSNPTLMDQVFAMVNRYMGPIMASGRGLSFDQNAYMMAALNQTAYLSSKDPKYLNDAEKFFKLGLEKSPNRPQFLYGLFDIYRTNGDKVKAKETADKILSLWPDDVRVGAALQEVFNPTATSTTSTKKKAK